MEYQEGLSAELMASPSSTGLAISALNGQRFYTNNQWPNPIVLKIENAQFKAIQDQKGRKVTIDGAK
ncbi:hypothetical protein RYH73_17040 [Olivibacter sp. CPCC 100613]|uniref:hypothetical protein n=1 Tax=Olivibacter sp. CPCC 100613 TaxID=3079931 RepID=UPI002FF852E4